MIDKSQDVSDISAPQREATLRDAIRSFAPIIRSDPRVRSAFRQYGPMRVWWRVILALHGRPTQITAPPSLQPSLIAKGFEVYGWLYRAVAIAMMILAAGAFLFRGILGPELSAAATAGPALPAAFLWIACGLLFSGAAEYRSNHVDAVPYLALGMVMIVTFLCMALLTAGAVVHVLGLVPVWLNVGALTCLITLGVGSYVLELVYLISVRHETNNPQAPPTGGGAP